MRIIAGEFRRRKLLVNEGLTTRPITDRVKEILFERIHGHFVDRRVLDVFSGTGSLGLEALSRGARSVVLMELDRKAFELLKQNVATLGVEDRTLCWRADALKSSFHPQGVDEFLPFDVVFFDPPYKMAESLGPNHPLDKSLRRMARDTVTAPDARLYFRTAEDVTPNCPDCWRHEDRLDVSSMSIHLFRKAGFEMRRTINFADVIRQRLANDSQLAGRVQRATDELQLASSIHSARIEAGLTREQLAKRAGTTCRIVAKIEDADWDGDSQEVVHRVAAALGLV